MIAAAGLGVLFGNDVILLRTPARIWENTVRGVHIRDRAGSNLLRSISGLVPTSDKLLVPTGRAVPALAGASQRRRTKRGQFKG